jgi:hypothetical protein
VIEMKIMFRALCVAVFLVGLLAFTQAQNSKQAEINSNADNDIEPAQSCIVKSIQYRINQDGSRQIMSRYTTYLKANGEFRQVAYGPNGPKDDNPLSKYYNEDIIYAGLSDGAYRKLPGSNTIEYISSRADEKKLRYFRSHKYFLGNKEFVRTDTVAGLKVYLMRADYTNPESDIEWIETSYSPKIAFGALRSRIHFRDGSEVVSEALSVEFTEVPEDLNDDLKNLPISNLEEKMQKQRQN